MSKAQMMILVRQSEQSARVIWDDGKYFCMLFGEVLQGRQPDARVRILLAVDFSDFDQDPRVWLVDELGMSFVLSPLSFSV